MDGAGYLYLNMGKVTYSASILWIFQVVYETLFVSLGPNSIRNQKSNWIISIPSILPETIPQKNLYLSVMKFDLNEFFQKILNWVI